MLHRCELTHPGRYSFLGESMTAQSSTAERPEVPAKVLHTEQQIEAAHYALLRRIAPCLRHHMVRPLQPIGLVYGVMRHKLDSPTPDIQSVRQDAEKINGFAKAALEECLDINTWIVPEPGELVALDAGVSSCVGLVSTMLHFCGFKLSNQIENLSVQVPRSGLRAVLIGALLQVSDALEARATLSLCASVVNGEAVLLLQVEPRGDGPAERYDEGYRRLLWDDVAALAAAENVGLSRGPDQVEMRFSIAG